jgi:hypothetical protein
MPVEPFNPNGLSPELFAEKYGMSVNAAIETFKRYLNNPESEEWSTLDYWALYDLRISAALWGYTTGWIFDPQDPLPDPEPGPDPEPLEPDPGPGPEPDPPPDPGISDPQDPYWWQFPPVNWFNPVFHPSFNIADLFIGVIRYFRR